MNLTHKKIEEIVNGENWQEWRTHKEGFTTVELHIILNKFDNINDEKVHDAMFGNTCMVIDGLGINYPWDVSTALICGIENRELTVSEWD